MSKKILEAKPVVKGSIATFEIELRFPISIDIDEWRKNLKEAQIQAGLGVRDWSKELPSEFLAIEDLMLELKFCPEASQEILATTVKLLMDRQRQLLPHQPGPHDLPSTDKSRPSGFGPLDRR